MIYRQLFLTFIPSKNLKLFFTLNYANDLKTIPNWLVLLSRCVRNMKLFHVNKNRSWAPQTHTRDIINYLTNLVFSVRTVSYGSSFFPLRFMAQARSARAINRGGKNSVRNLRYGPRIRLVRGMSEMNTICIHTLPTTLGPARLRRSKIKSCAHKIKSTKIESTVNKDVGETSPVSMIYCGIKPLISCY